MQPLGETPSFGFGSVRNKRNMITMAILLLVETADSFLTLTERSSLRWQPRTHACQAKKTSVETTLDTQSNDGDSNSWELLEDWTLQDKVPRFTVRSSHHGWKGAEVVTFWTQLRHSTPELSIRTESELEDRYRELSSTDTKTNQTSPSPQCGPSPPILSNWYSSTNDESDGDDKKSARNVGGTLMNGSTIWFPLQIAGSLGEDPIGGDAHDSLSSLGYVESMGGCIYELGAPKVSTYEEDTPTLMKLPSFGRFEHTSTRLDIESLRNKCNDLISSTKGALPSIITVSIISAFLAFNVGSSHTAAMQNPTVVVAILNREVPGPAGGGTELNLSEQRARMELQVGRDKRNLVVLQDRLNRDEVRMQVLRKAETRQEAAEYGF